MPNNHDGYDVEAAKFAGQLDHTDEVQIAGKHLKVWTQHSLYEIDAAAGTIAANGGEARPGFVNGATFGGSMLLSGRLLPGAHMEFVMLDEKNPYGFDGRMYTSSVVDHIEVVG